MKKVCRTKQGKTQVQEPTAEVQSGTTNEGREPEVAREGILVLTEDPAKLFGASDAVVPEVEEKDPEEVPPSAAPKRKPLPRVVPENFEGTELGVRAGKLFGGDYRALLTNMAILVQNGKVTGESKEDEVHVVMTDEIVDWAYANYREYVDSRKQMAGSRRENRNGSGDRSKSQHQSQEKDPLVSAKRNLGNAKRSLEFFVSVNRGLNLSDQKARLDEIEMALVFGTVVADETNAQIKSITLQMEEMAFDHLAKRTMRKLEQEASGLSSTLVQRMKLEIANIEGAFATDRDGSKARKAMLVILMERIPKAIEIARFSSPIPRTPRGMTRNEHEAKQQERGSFRPRR